MSTEDKHFAHNLNFLLSLNLEAPFLTYYPTFV